MSTQLNFLQGIEQSEARLSAELELLQSDVSMRIKATSNGLLFRSKDILGELPEQKAARETIERLQLRLELLRNIRMNWQNFQLSLNNRNMHMRINQDVHLKHLIAFLESGKGIQNEGEGNPATIPPERELMAYEVQPTGAGKTGAFAIDIALMDVPSITLVPLDSLLDQTKRDLIKIGNISEQDIGIVGGGSKEIGRKHTIATYAGHKNQMKKGGAYAEFVRTRCKLIICDEVHYSALGDRTQESILASDEEVDQEVLEDEWATIEGLIKQTSVASLKIGFTATPKGMQKNVQEYFPHFLGRVFHKEMVEEGLVVPYKIIQCDGTILESEIEKYMTIDKEVELLNREKVYEKLAGEYAKSLLLYKNAIQSQDEYPLRGISFCTNHAECENFVLEASKFDLRCKIVTGYEAKGRNGQKFIDEAVAALLSNECDLLVTVEKLATGFNCPELNAVIWARITSPAKTVQGIGRGSRAFTDAQCRRKQHCTVFETDWTIQENGKKSRKRAPVRLTDALAFNGEDPQGICTMADGSDLDVIRQFQLKEDGTVEIEVDGESGQAEDMKLAVSVNVYSKAVKVANKTLHAYIQEAGLEPVSNVIVRNNTRFTQVYWKDQVDALLPKRMAVNEYSIALQIKNEDGEGLGKERAAVSLAAYGKKLGITSKAIVSYAQTGGLTPVPDIKVLHDTASISVYWKDEVDLLIPKKVDDKGVVMLDSQVKEGIVQKRAAVSLAAYAKHRSIRFQTLERYVKEAMLLPIEGSRVWSGRRQVAVYWQDEVDPLLEAKIKK